MAPSHYGRINLISLSPGALLVMASLFLNSQPSAAQLTEDSVVEHSIDQQLAGHRYGNAINLALEASSRMQSQGREEASIFFLLRAAEIETFEVWKGKGFENTDLLPDYSRALRHLRTLHDRFRGKLDNYPHLKAKTLFTSAVVYYWLDMPDTAEVLHLEALDMRKKIFGEESREVADSHLWLGVLYNWGLQRRDAAMKHYEEALPLQKKLIPVSRYSLGSVYYGLSTLAMDDFRFDEALAFAEQYLALYHDLPYEQAFGVQLLANISWNQGDYERSLQHRHEAIRLYERSDVKEDLVVEYSNLANDLLNLGRFNEAEAALKKGQYILSSKNIHDPRYHTMLLASFGDLYGQMKRYGDAERNFKEALKVAVAQYGVNNDAVANIYRMRGRMRQKKGAHEDALRDFQAMLGAVVPSYAPKDLTGMPPLQNESAYFKIIIEASFAKGDVLFDWSRGNGDTAILMDALDNYRHGYTQIMIARNAVGDELSKPYLLSNYGESIEKSIACAHALFRRTRTPDHVDDMLHFVEFTKYLNVLDAVQRSASARNSRVPVDALLRMQQLRHELSMLQRSQAGGNEADAIGAREHIIRLMQERRQLMSLMGRDSTYASMTPGIVKVKDIQPTLAGDEQLIEFYWGRDSVYNISITNKSIQASAIVHDEKLDTLVARTRRALTRTAFSPRDVTHYAEQASGLYKALFEKSLSSKKVIVIPDGPLNLIPLEALVSVHNPSARSFGNLRYVVYDREVSYAYSASILARQPMARSGAIGKVLAFSFSGENIPPDGDNGLTSLSGARREAESLRLRFEQVTLFSGADARKGNFISHLEDHDVIHLGIHGIGDDASADNSRLIFMSDRGDVADLYAYEIYNLKIGARLTVLSACESGVGKYQSGEGVLSIARAFVYAGCPSVVMSIWRAHDQHTASVFNGFYQELHKGNSIRAALASAKRDFIRDADEFSSHPFYWSAFVLNGKDQRFATGSGVTWVWMIGIGVVLVCVLIAIRKKSFPGKALS